MRKSLAALAVLVTASAAWLGSARQRALAQSAASTVDVGGTAPPTCGFTAAPTQAGGSNMTLQGGATSAGGTVVISNLINLSNAQLNGTPSITLNFTGVCNYAHRVGLQTTKGGLTDNAPNAIVAGSFLTRVDYIATAFWASEVAAISTNGTPLAKNNAGPTSGANAGTLNLSIVLQNSSSLPVLTGTYTDTLKVQIGAAL